jgi:YHS domain-containing protein
MEQFCSETPGNPFLFDSVCGAPVEEKGANQFFDGERTYYFCSAYCRRLFLDQLHRLQAAGLLQPTAAGPAQPMR